MSRFSSRVPCDNCNEVTCDVDSVEHISTEETEAAQPRLEIIMKYNHKSQSTGACAMQSVKLYLAESFHSAVLLYQFIIWIFIYISQ